MNTAELSLSLRIERLETLLAHVLLRLERAEHNLEVLHQQLHQLEDHVHQPDPGGVQ